MWKFLIGIPLIIHGLANLGGFIAFTTNNAAGFNDRPWLFSGGISRTSPLGRIWGLVWLISMLALVGSGLGLIFGQAWALSMAVAGCIASFIAIVPWWNTVPPGARIGAIFDVGMTVILLTPWAKQMLG